MSYTVVNKAVLDLQRQTLRVYSCKSEESPKIYRLSTYSDCFGEGLMKRMSWFVSEFLTGRLQFVNSGCEGNLITLLVLAYEDTLSKLGITEGLLDSQNNLCHSVEGFHALLSGSDTLRKRFEVSVLESLMDYIKIYQSGLKSPSGVPVRVLAHQRYVITDGEKFLCKIRNFGKRQTYGLTGRLDCATIFNYGSAKLLLYKGFLSDVYRVNRVGV